MTCFWRGLAGDVDRPLRDFCHRVVPAKLHGLTTVKWITRKRYRHLTIPVFFNNGANFPELSLCIFCVGNFPFSKSHSILSLSLSRALSLSIVNVFELKFSGFRESGNFVFSYSLHLKKFFPSPFSHSAEIPFFMDIARLSPALSIYFFTYSVLSATPRSELFPGICPVSVTPAAASPPGGGGGFFISRLSALDRSLRLLPRADD